MHSPAGGAGVDHTCPLVFFVMTDVCVSEKYIVIILGCDGLEKTLFIIAVKHGNLPSRHIHLAEPTEQVDADTAGIKFKVGVVIGVAEYDVERNIDFLKKRSHFGENHFRADVAAMENRFNSAKDEFAGGRLGQIHLTMRVGYDTDFQLMSLCFSSWH